MTCRVVITGMGAVSPLGDWWSDVRTRLRSRTNAIAVMPEWSEYGGLATRLAAHCAHFEVPTHYERRKTRSMGRVAILATVASERALTDAGLLHDEILTSGATGVAYGSSSGSLDALMHYADLHLHRSTKGITATSYIQLMSHTCAANLALFFGLKGRVIPTSSACTSGSQGIGYAYEAIKFGRAKCMLAGGAEELSISEAAVFDALYATSTRNDEPSLTPRPFDRNRDGLVVGEGACTLVLEELSHALARGAQIQAELVGFGTNADGSHITNPEVPTMRRAMELSLEDARLRPGDIGYINAHGTATEAGDIAESLATAQLFGPEVPVSSLKSYMGHTMGAAGALEAWATISMMNDGEFAPTLNLEEVDPRCGALDYITGECRRISTHYVMSNNFAFGGINTSLIFKKWE
jgi:3-oxoacyl-[acyl-carrier-protein] synthase II